MHIVYALFLLLLLPLAVSAQIGTRMQGNHAANANPVAGTWTYQESGITVTLELRSDGSGAFEREPITYAVSGNQLFVEDPATGTMTTYGFQATESTLTLSGGDLDMPVTFRKSGTAPATAAQAPPQAPPAYRPAAQPPIYQAQPVDNQGIAGLDRALVGMWQTSEGPMDLRADGTVSSGGETGTWRTQGNVLTFSGPQTGTIQLRYAVNGNSLTLTSNQGSVVLAKMQPGQAKVAPELVGKWAKVSSGTGFSSETYFTLSADGTYAYHAESSRSTTLYNQYGDQTGAGGTAGASSDQGTWSYDGVYLHAVSVSGQRSSYRLEKRNHPKTGDPMLVLDGEAYVTFFQKEPWR